MSIDGQNKEKVPQLIAEIEALDLRTATVEGIQALLNTLLDGFPTSAMNIPPGKYIHRTSICQKPANIRRLSYPPAEVAILGRANERGKPRFYGSIGRSVPFFELNPQIGDTIALSTWRTTGDMLLNRVGFTKESSVYLGSKRELDKLYAPAAFLEELSEAERMVNDFLAKWFVRKISPEEAESYKLTAAIANILMGGGVFAGLVYPTVKMFGNADNLVLDPKFVDCSLELVTIEYLEITENAGINFKTELLDTAVTWDEAGNIEWTGRELGWRYQEMSKIYMKAEGGEWVNQDPEGKRIDPVPTNPIWRNPSPIGLEYKNCYPLAFKASGDAPLNGPDGEFNIKFSVIFDVEKKEKFLAFYIPRCGYPLQAAIALGNAYGHLMNMPTKDLKKFTRENADGSEQLHIDQLPDGRMMHFFSEEYIDAAELGKQIPAGYRLILNSQEGPPLKINYLYKPSKK